MSVLCSGQCLTDAHADCPQTITVSAWNGIELACECGCHQVFSLLEMEAV